MDTAAKNAHGFIDQFDERGDIHSVVHAVFFAAVKEPKNAETRCSDNPAEQAGNKTNDNASDTASGSAKNDHQGQD